MNGKFSPGVFICLIGENGHSGKLNLQTRVQSLLSLFTGGTGMLDDVIIESSEDLGEISVVILGIEESMFQYSWYVNEVGLYNFQSKKQDAFPCYHWISHGDRVSVIAKTGN